MGIAHCCQKPNDSCASDEIFCVSEDKEMKGAQLKETIDDGLVAEISSVTLPSNDGSALDEKTCPEASQSMTLQKSVTFLEPEQATVPTEDEIANNDASPKEGEVPVEVDLYTDIEALVDSGEWGESELRLLDLLDSAGSVDKERMMYGELESLPWFRKLLKRSKIFWDARQHLPLQDTLAQPSLRKKCNATAEGFPGWTALPTVRIDYTQLVPGSSASTFAHINPDVRLLWRSHEKHMMVKFLAEFPSIHPFNRKPFIVSFLSLWAEIANWPSWHPLVPGPPRLIGPQTVDYCTWQDKVYIPVFKSETGISEMDRLFSPEGFIVQKIESIVDENDDRVKGMDVSGGYSRKSNPDRTFSICTLGEDKTVLVVHYEGYVGDNPPSNMLVNFILKNILPTLAKKMFKAAAETFTNPYYMEKQAADETKVYARIKKAEQDGIAREQRSRHKFHTSTDRPHLDAFRVGDLWRRSLSQKQS
eukprot:TRINITY_DN74842_c0_g1_i1.p1 TRINITY_DN74842_c0_g1~~TRINITY_DN74842_c0_g1_i1.p1  ORF type:complete len:476 (-),score=39.47 TRINITY_DN74842_c0_g1_i1:216-1643(-)